MTDDVDLTDEAQPGDDQDHAAAGEEPKTDEFVPGPTDNPDA